MKKLYSVLLALLALAFFSFALAGMPGDSTGEILKVLERQKEAWNRGDLEGYMAYYWKSDELTFQSGASRVRGWQNLLERYRKSYSGDRMGQLDFSDLEVKILGSDYALVLGRWNVAVRGEKKGGVFTLIIKKFPEGWRIIHDHTS
ncbi:MAG: nuclear transport factor 2 family protein [Candidatus Saccharicenans sp.]|nr:nuclear transport factor 2 family protein [Candidatus Saccharicenans sp.]